MATTPGQELKEPLYRSEDEYRDVEGSAVQGVRLAATSNSDAPAKKKPCIQQVCVFELRFWICTLSCVLCYGIVQAYSYNSQTMLLERNYFTAPPNISDCCCWGEGLCYASWPNPSDENATAINASTYPGCTACASGFPDTQQPALNLTTEQMQHINCLESTSEYGLDKQEWGYGLPPLAPIANASDGYLTRYCTLSNEANEVAANVAAIPYDVGVVLSPFLGILLDRIGGTALIMALAPAGFAAAHVILGLFTGVPALVGLLIQGTACVLCD
jgi:hypothetical protein